MNTNEELTIKTQYTSELSVEDRLFQTAYNTFLRFGYHATSLKLIAEKADVSHSTIHYYFRSKEKLYAKIIEYIFQFILCLDFTNIENREEFQQVRWLLTTEQYNNKELFEKTLGLFGDKNVDSKLFLLNKWLEIVPNYQILHFKTN